MFMLNKGFAATKTKGRDVSLVGLFPLEKAVHAGAHGFGNEIRQELETDRIGMGFFKDHGLGQLFSNRGQGKPSLLESLHFLQKEEVLQGVTALTSLGSKRRDDSPQRLFPVAKGVLGNLRLAARFTNAVGSIRHEL